MSRIGSTSGVRVATQPLSNIYTVLLLVALLAVVVSVGILGYILQTRYGGTLGFGEDVDRELQQAQQTLKDNRDDLDQMNRTLLDYTGGAGAGPAPGGAGSPTPATQPSGSPLGASNG